MLKSFSFRAISLALTFWLLNTPAVLGCETGQSCDPDHDGNGFNNSFQRAQDLGKLADEVTGRPKPVSLKGELGTVIGGFDTVDYYKFSLPSNLFEVTFATTETPPTTSWIMIYDANKRPLISEEQGRGNDNELVTLNLSAGTYYVTVLTDRDVAGNRLLTYALNITPRIRPLPDQASNSCRPPGDLIELQNSNTISGSLTEDNSTDNYSIYMSYGTQLNAAAQIYPRAYNADLIDRASNKRISIIRNDQSGLIFTALDPGFYCLQVSSTSSPYPKNYEMQFAIPVMGLRPGTSTSSAPCVPHLNLGNLTRNGEYGQVRQSQLSDPNLSCKLLGVTQYVLREWVGTDRPEAWLRFDLATPRKLDLTISNLYNPVRADIQDTNGNILVTSTTSGTSISDQLPHQVATQLLQAGTYYLRVVYAGTRPTGTNVQILLIPNDP